MEIKSAEFVISNTNVNLCPKGNTPELAFIGRSNVGKSSLINMITNKPRLAKTSAKPGKTLLINHFIINKSWYIVDLPGYGYAKINKSGQKSLRQIIDSYILQRQQLFNLFVLIDSRLEPQQIDLDFINWLGTSGIPFAIVFTKTDKQSKAKTTANVETFKQKLLETWEELPPVFLTSAEKKIGKEEVLDYIESILDKAHTKE
jgi:GTP-binding protein